MRNKSLFLGFLLFSIPLIINAQKVKIPKVYSNIKYKKGILGVEVNGVFNPEEKINPLYTYTKIVKPNLTGDKEGITFDFKDPNINGKLIYGLIKMDGVKYPHPVYFKRTSVVKEGKSKIRINQLKGKYDFVNWEKTHKLTLGYRYINEKGEIIFDGELNVKLDPKGRFVPDITLIEGPFVNKLTESSAVISFKTTEPVIAQINIGNDFYSDIVPMTHHEILVSQLKPGTEYTYEVLYGDWKESYSLTTANKKGCRSPFIFAYASDSRAGQGGGERNLFGVNAFVVKKMFHLAEARKASFFQFTGDMINGYSGSPDEMNLQYLNWKHSVQDYWYYHPIYVGTGNHENVERIFKRTGYTGHSFYLGHIFVDRFPFKTDSQEAVFASNFTLPVSDLESEDGSNYDPSNKKNDFPSYKELVYDYTYGNLAMIVLNSNYWYASSTSDIPVTSGNVHGYVMDNQLKWLRKTIDKYEKDDDIDHIIVTIHTPLFPNAGHSGDDMWYNGNNDIRPYVAGKPVEKGIIERRDEILDILVNKSDKFVVLLAGDEHNYSRLVVDNKTNIYPENWSGKRIKLKRPFIQITNGSAGAPYYSLENLPWTPSVKKFSTLYALMLFEVNSQHIQLEVINPETFEEIEKVQLK
jgi:hypothetical protein